MLYNYAAMHQRKVLVVEDEQSILELISYNLAREGYKVLRAMNGDDGLKLAQQEVPDAVLLDVMLPGTDGVEVCRQLKSNPSLRDIPVLMVTARGEESDIVLGLTIGADDYIPKPFSPRELVARVKAAMRRGPLRESQAAQTTLVRGRLTIDTGRHEVTIDGGKLQLTPSEFRLLYKLAAEPGRVYEREELLDAIGGGSTYVIERNVDAHVKSIRKKLGRERDMIETVRGVGYRFKDERA